MKELDTGNLLIGELFITGEYRTLTCTGQTNMSLFVDGMKRRIEKANELWASQ